MHIEHETSDRHRRIGAVAHEIVPVAVAQLGGVEPERLEQILRMLRRHAALGQRAAQRHRFRAAVAGAEKVGLHAVEHFDFLRRRQRGMVGDVVGRAHEFVEGQNQRAVARLDQPRRDGKILVAVAFAGPE